MEPQAAPTKTRLSSTETRAFGALLLLRALQSTRQRVNVSSFCLFARFCSIPFKTRLERYCPLSNEILASSPFLPQIHNLYQRRLPKPPSDALSLAPLRRFARYPNIPSESLTLVVGRQVPVPTSRRWPVAVAKGRSAGAHT